MKVLHLLQSNRFSGAENVVCQIISMFRDTPDVEMVYCSRDGQIREALEERSIAFAPMSQLSIDEVKRVIREQRPDVIHAHDMRASYIAARAHGKVKLVSHIHNSDFRARKLSVKSISYWLASLSCSRIFWVSDSCLESYFFSRLVKRKSQTLSNMLDRREILYKADMAENQTAHDVVYVGRLAEPKNPQRLIRIVSEIKKQKPDISVGIVGTGDLEATTQKLVHDLQLEDSITFYGFQRNPLGILKNAKVMVITSDREGLPMVSLEAMALGVPIVSTPIDGLRDIVKNSVNGYLESDEKIFAQRVMELVSDCGRREAFSKEVLSTFEKNNDLEFYKNVLKEAYNAK